MEEKRNNLFQSLIVLFAAPSSLHRMNVDLRTPGVPQHHPHKAEWGGKVGAIIPMVPQDAPLLIYPRNVLQLLITAYTAH